MYSVRACKLANQLTFHTSILVFYPRSIQWNECSLIWELTLNITVRIKFGGVLCNKNLYITMCMPPDRACVFKKKERHLHFAMVCV